MKIDILTIFPEMFDGFINTSIIKRAIDSGKVDIKVHNFRDYSMDKHKKVDDYPYGGGAGMVLMCEPIFRAVEDIIGLNVYVGDRLLGRVNRIDKHSVNEILVIKSEEKNYLVPYNFDIILSVDLEKKEIRVKNIVGLFD